MATTKKTTKKVAKDKWQEWADMEIPTRKELGMNRGNCPKCSNLENGDIIVVDKNGNCVDCKKNYIVIPQKMNIYDKITLVLTIVNVAIFISLVIKNV